MSNEHKPRSTSTVTGKTPTDMLIALAYGPPNADGNYEVSEEEVEEARTAGQHLPPEYQAALDSLGPDFIREITKPPLPGNS